jgi:AcrR family transcriptional regulator
VSRPTDSPNGPDRVLAPARALPAKQARSRQTRDRLLAAGRALIDTDGFERTSVAEIARAAGCSVGAFYFRYRDKESFFGCVVDAAMADPVADLRARIEAGGFDGMSADETVAACVAHYVAFAREHAGLLRALHRRTEQDPASWQPVRDVAAALVGLYVERIAAAHGRPGDAALSRQATIGLQIVAGALVHAVLNDPPFLGLESPELGFWLGETVKHCLAVEPPARIRRTGRPAPR